MSKYTQCLLVKHLAPNRTKEQMAYIPSKFAKTNNVIKIKVGNDWDDGWTVQFVYNSIEDVVPVRQSRKRHRKNTGDSLPKNAPS
jgi:hypothetical protein